VPRPAIIAHRGASRERPENTMPAFERALELGVDGIELDVHATRDGIVVVHHDPAPAGTPPDEEWLAGRAIAELSLRELRRFGAAPGVGIPTLAQLLRAVGGRAELFVEVKGRGIEALVVETIRAAKGARCAVHGFDHRAVRRVREVAPELRGGVLLSSALVDPAAAMRAAGAEDYWIAREWADEPLVRAVHAAGGRVIVWTVNEPDEMRALAALGVDGICTDDPALARATLDGGEPDA
jgi:glycerophosphoryl diester phosphodiesterase